MKPRVLILLAVLLAGITGFVLLFPGGPSPASLPNPNGYDDFLAAGQRMDPRSSDYPFTNLTVLREIVASNAPGLALVRTGLSKSCRVPLTWNRSQTNAEERMLHLNMQHLSQLKLTALAFRAESVLLARQGRTNEAALSALDCIRFGSEGVRGGPIIDHLVGVAIRAIGLRLLSEQIRSLDAPTLALIAAQLEALVASHETTAQIQANEADWVRANLPLQLRFGGRLMRLMGRSSDAAAIAKIAPSLDQLVNMMVDAASRAYELDHGRPPVRLEELVPRYLKAIPGQSPATPPAAR